ncbi:DUF4097 family beta strand repeat-containing protein [Alteromonas sp. CYL-A6]|uniref:DUF4097 family beta strand repeat-containing protein n=1 Tax=Alteromonas nitratireducens TaxID=3390813 RepID=UPI0034AE257D
MKTVNKTAGKYVQWSLALLTGLTLVSQVAIAGERVDQTLETSDSPYVDIEHMNGKARILGWEKEEVKVTGELGEQTDRFTFEKSDRAVTIHIDTKRYNSDWRSYKNSDGDNLTIYVPYKALVSYTSINARLQVEDLTHSLKADVVNGDVSLSDVKGKVSVDSVNGDIMLDDVAGDVVLQTVNGAIEGKHISEQGGRFGSVNGDIDIRSNSPRVSVETVNGNLNLQLGDVRELDIDTVNGRINASMTLDARGDVRASSVGGSITLNFQQDVSARFDTEAHAGGRIINNITDDEMVKAKYGPRRWLEFVHNGGEARVNVSTVSGRITLNN